MNIRSEKLIAAQKQHHHSSNEGGKNQDDKKGIRRLAQRHRNVHTVKTGYQCRDGNDDSDER